MPRDNRRKINRADGLISREEATQRAGVSLSTIDRWIRKGDLKAHKMRWEVLIDPESLDEIMRPSLRS